MNKKIIEISCCEECEFKGKEQYHGAHIWCEHPKACGLNLPNHLQEIHPDCPITTIKIIKHVKGEYKKNINKYFKNSKQ